MPVNTRHKLVLTLREAAGADPRIVGTKAATLGRLVAGGFAVPEGLVMTTEAFAGASPGTLSEAAERALATASERFPGVELAVRSSAVAEDLAGASYAGQYETVLGVRGPDALRDAVLRCLASASAARVRGYARGEPAPMAVLIQRQCAPEAAGVAFTADPVTGDRDRVLVSATPGLGDAVAAGRVTPDEWIVTGPVATAARAEHGALTSEQAHAVAALARRVENALGGPQDVEWAMDDGRLLLLQARPITALPEPPAARLPEGTWLKETDRYAGPMTALGASGAVEMVGAGLTAMFREYGSLIDRVDCVSIGGEIYQRLTPLGGGEGSGPPPWFVLAILSRTVPALRGRMRQAGRAASPRALEHTVERWRSTWRPELQRAAERFRSVPPADLDDAELAARLTEVLRHFRRSMDLHFRMTPPYLVPLHTLVLTCRAVLGWDTRQTLDLLAGTSRASVDPSLQMAKLAARVRERPGLEKALRSTDDPWSILRAESPALADDFDRWCDAYAYRCVSDDPGSPTLVEQPHVLAHLLCDTVVTDDAETVQRAARARAAEELAGRRPRARKAFDAALAAATSTYGLRDDVGFWTASVPGGLVRLTAMEAGRRLVAAGRLDRADDVVHLELGTLRRSLTDPALDLREPVRRARAERAWVHHHPGPAVVGPAPAPPPDIRGIPRTARRLNAALLWSRFGERAVSRTNATARVQGAAGSPGRHTGPVRIIRNEADFPRLGNGDVLVTVMTDPAWSVLFGVAGALVTDTGGLLSHAAIVAREHGIPAVVGTGSATSLLHDGDLVTVDGSRGLVLAADPAIRKEEEHP